MKCIKLRFEKRLNKPFNHYQYKLYRVTHIHKAYKKYEARIIILQANRNRKLKFLIKNKK